MCAERCGVSYDGMRVSAVRAAQVSWETDTFGRWTGNLLAQETPRKALKDALGRLRPEPFGSRARKSFTKMRGGLSPLIGACWPETLWCSQE
jgi:hypothetical protein